MKRLAVIRPQPGCDVTVAAARALGLDAHGFPMFALRPLDWEPPEASQFDALLIGSANVLRLAGAALAAYRGLPVYAVGEVTAQEAGNAGFANVVSGEGGLQSLLDSAAPGHKHLLRLAASKRVSLAAPPGITIEERIVYESAPLPMPDALAVLLEQSSIVLLHSAEAARHFAAQCEARGIDRAAITLAALAPRIAEAAGGGWQQVQCCDAPQDKALLALARDMCQTGSSR